MLTGLALLQHYKAYSSTLFSPKKEQQQPSSPVDPEVYSRKSGSSASIHSTLHSMDWLGIASSQWTSLPSTKATSARLTEVELS